MAVDAVVLIRFYLIAVHLIEIGDGAHRRYGHGAFRTVAVVFDDPSVSIGIGDVEVVVASAGSEHVILLQEVHGFLRRGGAVQNEPDDERRCNGRFSGILMCGLTVEREYRDGHALFIHAVEADEGSGQAGELCLDAFIRNVGCNVVQSGKRNGSVAFFRGTVHEKRRGVEFEVVVAAHQHMAVLIGHREGAAAEIRRFHMDGKKRERLSDDGVQHGLIVGDAAGDHRIQIVVILHIHAVEIVVVLVCELLKRRDGAKPPGVDHQKDDQNQNNQRAAGQKNSLDHFCHKTPF